MKHTVEYLFTKLREALCHYTEVHITHAQGRYMVYTYDRVTGKRKALVELTIFGE